MGLMPGFDFCVKCSYGKSLVGMKSTLKCEERVCSDLLSIYDKVTCEQCNSSWYHQANFKKTYYIPTKNYKDICVCESYDADKLEEDKDKWRTIENNIFELLENSHLSRPESSDIILSVVSKRITPWMYIKDGDDFLTDVNSDNITIYVNGEKQDLDNWAISSNVLGPAPSCIYPKDKLDIPKGSKITVDITIKEGE